MEKDFPPPEQKDHSWWAFTVDDDPPWTISIQVLPHRPRGPMTCQTTRGPGRTNLGKDLTPAQGAPQQGTTESNENRRSHDNS